MKNYWKSKMASVLALSVGALLVSNLPAMAEGIVLSAKTRSAVEAGGKTDVEIRLSVVNSSSEMAKDISLTFEDGTAIHIRRIEAGASSKALPVFMTLDTASMPTRNYPVAVKLNYIQAASVVQEDSSVVVTLAD